MTCSGHVELFVTTDYEGAHEEVLSGGFDPNAISHAAALEVARDAPVKSTVFAMGWIPRVSTDPKVALYRYNPAGFTTTVTLPYQVSSRKWIARSGYDPTCAATVSGATGCAWFAWTDKYGDVDWIAVGDNGATGGLSWVHGWDASGDVGIVYFSSGNLERQLRVYISPDRTQVLAKIYEGTNLVGGPVILRTVQNNFKAYQTTVAWSERNQRWLVVWGEYYMNSDHYWKSKVTSRIVRFDGTLGLAKSVMYCEQDPNTSRCSVTKVTSSTMKGSLSLQASPDARDVDGELTRPDSGPTAPIGKHNTGCACYGIWLGASRQWNTWPDVDAFRVHQYGVQARIDGEGDCVAWYVLRDGYQSLTHECSTYCPLDRLPPKWLGVDTGVYQMARQSGNSAEMIYEAVASPVTALQDQVHPFTPLPQALRTTGDLTATLATNHIYTEPSAWLRLTISDAGSGVCP
ncbi:MAG: hypothetical protein KAI47_17310 [Deltaproteobacteria bacterium]|nr:hypothetical protein [Deltaproteobacteria bacterium]